MGIIRKTIKLSTLGMAPIHLRDKEERIIKANERELKVQRQMLKEQRQAAEHTRLTDARKQADADKPWYRQPTVSAALQKARADNVAATDDAPAERLRTLAELHDHGILTDEEFAAKKAELLDRL